MQYFAVMGNPIAQSKSPFIHHMFASQAGVDIQYDAVLVEKHQFNDAVADFFSKENHIGLNVTVPFKEVVLFALADVLTDEAKTAGAVNTLYSTVNGLLGHNTDGPGLMQDILRQNQVLKDKRILMIGAGGAARGVIMPFSKSTCCVYSYSESQCSKGSRLWYKRFRTRPLLLAVLTVSATNSSISS